MRKVTKAVIAAAGYGTRFLPATKNVPKELLPVIDMPVLEYVTQECVDSGITDIIIVTSYGKNAIEDYFDSSKELEDILEKKGKYDLLKKVQNAYQKANFVFVRQNKNLPIGTCSPLLCVKNLIDKNEGFAYLYGDDIYLDGQKPALRELIEVYCKVNWCYSVIGAKRVSAEDVSKFGLVKYHKERGYNVIDDIIEKPQDLSQFENNKLLVSSGRFILNERIFEYINEKDYIDNPRGELELHDTGRKFRKKYKEIVVEIKSNWYPTGKPMDMLKSTIKIALKRSDTKEELKGFLKSLKY